LHMVRNPRQPLCDESHPGSKIFQGRASSLPLGPREAMILSPPRPCNERSSQSTFQTNQTALVLTPSRRECMWKAGKLFVSRLPDLALVEMPIEIEAGLSDFLNFERTDVQFWSYYQSLLGVTDPFLRAARYSWDLFFQEIRRAKLLKPELIVACYGSLQAELAHARISEKLLAMELRSKISGIDAQSWRQYLAEELQQSQIDFRTACYHVLRKLRRNLANAVLWRGSAYPIIKILRGNRFAVQVCFVEHYLKPPLSALITLARIRGLSKITNEQIHAAVGMHLQYLDIVISSDNLDLAHRRWENLFRANLKHSSPPV